MALLVLEPTAPDPPGEYVRNTFAEALKMEAEGAPLFALSPWDLARVRARVCCLRRGEQFRSTVSLT